MSTQFFNRLSQNYIEILNDDEYYDITIETGKGPKCKNIPCTHDYPVFTGLHFYDELYLQQKEYIYGELVDYLQKYLIKNKVKWIEQHFGLAYRTSFQSNSLLEFQQFCIDCMTKSRSNIQIT
ncbi:unnamed protein product [Rhizophagus irregularis]|nr:unnamed protein product [Rhizophagus irregularis]